MLTAEKLDRLNDLVTRLGQFKPDDGQASDAAQILVEIWGDYTLAEIRSLIKDHINDQDDRGAGCDILSQALDKL